MVTGTNRRLRGRSAPGRPDTFYKLQSPHKREGNWGNLVVENECAPVRLSPPAKAGTGIGCRTNLASTSGVDATTGMRAPTRQQGQTLKNGSEPAQRAQKHRNPDFYIT